MIHYEQLMFSDKIYSTNTVQISVCHPKDRNFDLPIRNEEDFSKRRILKN